MGTDFPKRISLGLQCVLQDELKGDFLAFYGDVHPEAGSVLQEVEGCLVKTDVESCLKGAWDKKEWEGSWKLSSEAEYFCDLMNHFLKRTSKEEGNSYRFISRLGPDLFHSRVYSKHYTPNEFAALEDVASFYYQRLPSWIPPMFSYLKTLSPLRGNLKAYESRKTDPQYLVPVACKNREEWERFDLPIQGVAHQVPVFFPKRDQQRWWFYQDLLKAKFEVIKGFLAPQDLEKILHPGGNLSDFGLYIAGEGKGVEEIHQRCGMDSKHASGEYYIPYNRLHILKGNWRADEGEEKSGVDLNPVTDSVSKTFYHEIGHAIFYILLTDQARRGVAALHYWIKREIGSDSRRFSLTAMPEGVVADTNKPYSLEDHGEFFAEWVAEYFRAKIKGEVPTEPALRARIRILDDFFAVGGIRPEALSRDNIERRFHENKIEMTLARKGPTLFLRGGLEYLSLPFGGEDLGGTGLRLGAGLGYLYQRDPKGIVWGTGLSYDFYKGGDYRNRGEGLQDQFSLGVHDLGAWGLVGYNFGPFDLSLQPVVGYRLLKVSTLRVDETAQGTQNLGTRSEDRFFWGGDLIFNHHKTGLGARLGARNDLEGGLNLGVSIVFDPFQVYRFWD